MPTYNVVTDLGMDDTGSSDNFPIFKNNIGDNVTMEFPPGTYAFGDGNDNGWWDTYDVDNFTMRGADGNGNLNSSHRDAVLKPLVSGDIGGSNRFGNFDGVDHTFENLTFGAYDDDVTDMTLWVRTGDNLLMRQVEFWGRFPEAQYTGSQLNVEIGTNSGTGELDRVAFGTKYGAVMEDYPNARALTFTDGHDGECHVHHCRWRDVGGSGIRGQHHDGTVILEDSHFQNVGNAAIRTNATADAVVRNCEVIQDNDLLSGDTLPSTEALRVDADGGSCRAGGLVENLDVFIASNVSSTGAVTNRGFSDASDLDFRNSRIQHDSGGGWAIRVSNDSCSGFWQVDNVAVTGANATTINEKSGELNGCCFPSGVDLSDWNTVNIQRDGCNGPVFSLLDHPRFWPETGDGDGGDTGTDYPAHVPIMASNGTVDTVNGRGATVTQVNRGETKITSWEDGTELSHFDHDTDYYEILNEFEGLATDGTNALVSQNGTSNFYRGIYSTSGLPAYPDDSTDIYRVDVQANDTQMWAEVMYRVNSTTPKDDKWRVRFEMGNGNIVLIKEVGDSDTDFAVTTHTFSANTVYTVEFDPNGGNADEFVATVFEGGIDGTQIAQFTSDTTHSGNTGIGFIYNNRSDTNENVGFDNLRLV